MNLFSALSVAVALSALATSTPVLAAEIVSAKLDGAQKNILIDVRHGGGCGTHDYSLKMKGCAESMPVQCQAELVHMTNDFCEAFLSRTAVINLEASGIKGDYFSGGSLTITGANQTKATIRLPEFTTPLPPVAPPISTTYPNVECTTHTGSKLEIFEAEGFMTLLTYDGEKKQYSIVDKQVLVLEVIPEIFESRYKLDDGRTVVTQFRKRFAGEGFFIRLAGDTSPRFQCKKLN